MPSRKHLETAEDREGGKVPQREKSNAREGGNRTERGNRGIEKTKSKLAKVSPSSLVTLSVNRLNYIKRQKLAGRIKKTWSIYTLY